MSRGFVVPLPEPEPWQSRGTASAAPDRRLVWVDALRGAALVGMVVFHVTWDLHAFGLWATDPSGDPAWHAFGTGVATLFLTLSGFGLALAERRGISWRRILTRLGRIAAAAALVTLVTLWAVPQAPVWFGILHCIAVTNAIALTLRRAPTVLLLALAAAAWGAPHLVGGAGPPGLTWLGLGAAEPATLDFRPVLPWLAPVLAGVALGRLTAVDRLGAERARTRWLRPVGFLGRHSLAVYLIHQPIIVGILMAALGGFPDRDTSADTLRRPDEAVAFLRQCRSQCLASGGAEDLCSSTCHCVLTAVGRGQGRDGSRLSEGLSGDTALGTAVALCRAQASTHE